jgi:BirA family biotin operon repressor/biotin-[acetyl-CoA-carboxylase] ligase
MTRHPDVRNMLDPAIPRSLVDRSLIVEHATSTQDLALRHCDARPGLVVIAHSQSAGRGRLASSWLDPAGRGLAMTVVLPGNLNPGTLSLGAGLAACRACEDAGARSVALRWPNDLVERATDRKIAGILIEKRQGLFLAGFGVNLAQREADFPRELRPRVASLAMLGAHVDLLPFARTLLRHLAEALALPPHTLAREWAARDVLLGSERTFEHDGQRFTGLVESIDPAAEIVLRSHGRPIRLPAPTTRLLPPEP